MIFLKEEIPNKRQKEANINENNINKNNNELINKNDINLITKSELPDKESYEETTRHSKNDSNEESNTIKGSNHKKEKIKSNKVSGNNKMKTKPKLKLKKSYNKNTYNKFNPNLLVAVFSFQKLIFIFFQIKRGIRANSHESDFSPPVMGIKNSFSSKN
ncbi:hypothetical protein H8356DRAFT_1369792 [Neocallimastix lanati (nom. inval.)]|nr:hypothetical protein H8356DRAFT_1369792 [Neocallimastix sp. JGI-2020a]